MKHFDLNNIDVPVKLISNVKTDKSRLYESVNNDNAYAYNNDVFSRQQADDLAREKQNREKILGGTRRWELWSSYLLQFLLSSHKKDNVTRLKSSGTIMESLHVRAIENFLVIVPPIPE